MSENDIYTITLDGVLLNNQVNCVFGFVQTSVTGGFIGQALIDEFQAMVLPSFLACCASGVVINTIRCHDIVPGTSAAAEETLSANNVGTVSGQVLPSQVASLVTWTTNRSGRSYRGRTYLPGPSVSVLAPAGTWLGAHVTAMTAFRNALLTNFGPTSSGSFRFGIISRWNNKVERPVPVITHVTNGIIRNTPAVQRRRRLGVGA